MVCGRTALFVGGRNEFSFPLYSFQLKICFHLRKYMLTNNRGEKCRNSNEY